MRAPLHDLMDKNRRAMKSSRSFAQLPNPLPACGQSRS